MTSLQRTQQRLWDFIYPIFPFFERTLRPLRFRNRHPYLLGKLRPEKTLDDLRAHLRARWEFDHVVAAWTDDGQVLSWRRRVSFEHQYHIRVFEDGEVRGHFEYTPEAAPLWHLMEFGMEERRNDFLQFLDGHLAEEQDAREDEEWEVF